MTNVDVHSVCGFLFYNLDKPQLVGKARSLFSECHFTVDIQYVV